jgi:predicted RND superfamily exporter protein
MIKSIRKVLCFPFLLVTAVMAVFIVALDPETFTELFFPEKREHEKV